ncbi:MAG: alkaline phosphatase family protein [Elusimicrobia bacterium]|nr:alkaline phosphatase family protein [Elusimicrobiota bacterium]
MIRNRNGKRVLILGIDALSPSLLERYIEDLPNIRKLMNTGYYHKLGSVNPPQSPVVWRSFATGNNPGNHGLFDFIYRDPGDYLPRLSFSKVFSRSGNAFKSRLNRNLWGKTFWERLSEHGIKSVVLWAPTSFPPDRIKGRLISGMGVPDIRGMLGSYTYVTSREYPKEDRVPENTVFVKKDGGGFSFDLEGPSFLKSGKIIYSAVRLNAVIKGEGEVLIKTPEREIVLRKKEWSGWISLKFKMGSGRRVSGICRLYLIRTDPEIELYISPFNIDPSGAVYPLSSPGSFAKKLFKKYGYYSTLGMPYDTKAVDEGVLSDEAFLELSESIYSFRKQVYLEQLKTAEKGLVFGYFEILDIIQHMFWRFMDESGSKKAVAEENDYKDTIRDCYRKIDGLIGETVSLLNDDDVLIVVSDHGFSSFKKAVHLNSWLRSEGYLKIAEDKTEGGVLFKDVDWDSTKAYALGFGGIYINLKGREKFGCVQPSDEYNRIREQIKDKLESWSDPATGSRILNGAYLNDEIFAGEHLSESPDLYCGFNLGYRASWQTAIGGAPVSLLEDNMKKWRGDHIMDAVLLPGVIISNRQFDDNSPDIIDIAPTVMELFGVENDDVFDGKSLLSGKRISK